jgi:hypothetical protein
MRRGFVLLASALMLLAGCSGKSGTSAPGGGSTTHGPTAADAEAAVRGAVPAAEAYGADHGTYKGLTVAVLRTYDNGVGDVTVAAERSRYCIQASAEGVTFSFTGPRGKVIPVGCGTAPPPADEPAVAPPTYEAQTNVRAAVPAIEAWHYDHGSYEGMTVARLRSRYDYGIPDVTLVDVRRNSYCVESSGDGETWSYRTSTGLTPKGC